MPVFYAPEITGFLSKEESLHASKVLRLKSGSEAIVVDGIGGKFDIKLVEVNSKKCSYEILQESKDALKKHRLIIAVCPTKNFDRYKWMVEKLVELGVDEIVSILCQRSERRKINREKLQLTAISAMKQSQQAYLPKVREIIDFKDFLQNDTSAQKFIAHCEAEQKKDFSTAINAINKETSIILLIGPEGDFTPDEIELAKTNGFTPVSLGNTRLRTETAALYGCSVVKGMMSV